MLQKGALATISQSSFMLGVHVILKIHGIISLVIPSRVTEATKAITSPLLSYEGNNLRVRPK